MRWTHIFKVSLSLLFPVALVACSSGGDGTGGSAGAGAGGGTGGSTSSSSTGGSTTSGTGGTPVECEGPGYEGNEADVNIGKVSASVIDQNGDPAAQTAAQVCGTDICIAETTGDNGSVTVLVNQTLKKPAFKYGDGIVYSKLAILLEAGDFEFTNLVTSKLPPIGQGDAFASGASVSSSGVTIDIPAGGIAEVDSLIYPEPVDQVFRAAEIPVSPDMPGVDPSLGIEAIFGVAPLETVFCPPAKVHFPNTAGLPAGADVEILIQGLDALQHWAPYGEWLKVSDGKVSADGSEIVTVDGQGLPVLSTFGVRLK
ncbi:MAG: hypothetical protein IPK82_40610 [Polyangiaceae bacterium]|nr:hypothetical protein [Polyangiaceae bacterium]